MFAWALRIAGWIVGIYALLKLATLAGNVTYTAVFQAWLDSLRNIIDLGFLLTPLKVAIILPALDFIRSFGFHIPPLQDHWQQVFVLAWLLAAAFARNLFLGVSTPVALLAAFVVTLPFCLAAGTMPVGSLAVLFWPLAGFFAFAATITLFRGISWVAMIIVPVGAAAFAAVGSLVGPFNVGSAALVMLAVAVGGMGLWVLVLGLRYSEGNIRQRIQSPVVAIGLDITAAMLGAFGLATAFADPPLF